MPASHHAVSFWGVPGRAQHTAGPSPHPPNKLWVKPTKSILLALRVRSFDLRAHAPPASEAVEGVLGSGLCFPISREGWQRRPSRLPHHCPLISLLHFFRPQLPTDPSGGLSGRRRLGPELVQPAFLWVMLEAEAASLSQTEVSLVHTPAQPLQPQDSFERRVPRPTPSAAPRCFQTQTPWCWRWTQAPSHPRFPEGTTSCLPALAGSDPLPGMLLAASLAG